MVKRWSILVKAEIPHYIEAPTQEEALETAKQQFRLLLNSAFLSAQELEAVPSVKADSTGHERTVKPSKPSSRPRRLRRPKQIEAGGKQAKIVIEEVTS